ncbi:methylated-DNA--[protein]-cysteine S-methyltransferase [Enterobacteriaceae bacterium ESL0689]|nr:methylated-DNA--[protein]-cysteine S-methyltransferase [Enterobacteriaceae bacterium ESL0689]
MYHDQLICPASFPWRFVNIIASHSHIIEVMFSDTAQQCNPNELTQQCKEQLMQYFFKQLTSFCLPIISQGSLFASSVYNELIRTEYGSTKTYKEIAIALGSEKKSRAVGHACSQNRISIIVPCHRIISSNGKLTGYTGGTETKKWLINHEKSTSFCNQAP